jgi:hypothetical protein
MNDFAILSLARLPISPPWLKLQWIFHEQLIENHALPCYSSCYCDGMQRAATQRDEQRRKNHGESFLPVADSRKRKIVGLWQRGDRYDAQLRVDLGNGRTAPRQVALEADAFPVRNCLWI